MAEQSQFLAKKVKELLWFHPKEPKIELDKKINKQLLFENILKPYFDLEKMLGLKKKIWLKDIKTKNQWELQFHKP